MSDPTTAVREHLVRVLDWGEAHVTFDKAVDGITPDRQGARTDGFEHTLWQLVEHIRIAQEDILRFSQSDAHKSPPWPKGYWPGFPGPAREGQWQETVDAVRRDLAEFESLLKDPAQDLFRKLPWGEGQTLLREALLLADHNAYHVGQMVLLRQQLGVWPAS